MKFAFFLAFLAMTSLTIVSPANACTQEGSRLAAKARKKGLVGKKRVEGKFVVERTEIGPADYDSPVTIYGTITSKKGKSYPVVQHDNGAIILCATYYPAISDAEGMFYIAKNESGSWRIIHTDRKKDE